MSNAQQLIGHAARLLDLKGDTVGAERALREAIASASLEGHITSEAQAATFLGELLLELGRRDEALVLFRNVVDRVATSDEQEVVSREIQICQDHLAAASAKS